MARVTLVGEQVLAAYPDTGVGRATLVGEQILADAPPNVTRVSNSSLEVLVQGAASPRARVTLAGEQVLARVPQSPMRVSNVVFEALVTGNPATRGRVSLVGEQILARTPPAPMRVSNSLLEVLIAGIPEELSKGRLYAASATATREADYPQADAALSDARVDAMWQAAALPTVYEDEGSGGRLHGVLLTASSVSSIMTAPPAGRLYHTLEVVTFGGTYPNPDASLSDLYASALAQSAALGAVYAPEGSDLFVAQVLQLAAADASYAELGSTLTVTSLSRQAAFPAAYEAAGSTLTASALDQRLSLEAAYLDKGELQSILTVTHAREDLAAGADYSDKDAPASTLSVDVLSQKTSIESAYLPASEIVPEMRLHQVALSAALPASWLELQRTMLRLHFAARQATLPSTYPDPVDVRPVVQVSYLAPAVAVESASRLGGGSSAQASQVAQLVATSAVYEGPDAPQSVVSVDDMALLVVAADNDFGELAAGEADSLPIVSIQLFYEE